MLCKEIIYKGKLPVQEVAHMFVCVFIVDPYASVMEKYTVKGYKM